MSPMELAQFLSLLCFAFGVGWYGAGVALHDHSDANNGGALGDAADRPAWFGLEQIVAPTALPAANVLNLTDLPQTYSALLLVVTGASSDTATRRLRVQVSLDNGANFDTDIADYPGSNVVAGVGVGTPTSEASLYLMENLTLVAAGIATFVLHLAGYQAGGYPVAHGAGLIAGAANSCVGSYIGSTGAITALRLIWNDTGNFDAGTYALYGIR